MVGAFRTALNEAVLDASRAPEVPIPESRGREVAAAVERRAMQKLAADPAFQHATNSEPWYRSRVTIGALVALAAGLAGLAGFALEADDVALLTDAAVAAGAVAGAAISLYGRWRARAPIGS